MTGKKVMYGGFCIVLSMWPYNVFLVVSNLTGMNNVLTGFVC